MASERKLTMQNTLDFVRLDHRATLPVRAHPTDAGLDIFSIEARTLQPGCFHAFQTGVAVSIPAGCEGQIRPRSGLAKKHGITVLNSPGTVDAGYCGEILVLLYNAGQEPYKVTEKDRIAQLVVVRVELLDPVEVTSLDETDRGAGGFGSTGL